MHVDIGLLLDHFSESKERETHQKAIVEKFFAKEKQTRETTKMAKARFESMAAESSQTTTQSTSRKSVSSMAMSQQSMSQSMSQTMSSSSSTTTTQQMVSKSEKKSVTHGKLIISL